MRKCLHWETGLCPNGRLRDHICEVKNRDVDNSKLARHVDVCRCEPQFATTEVTWWSRDVHVRQVIEATEIERVSDASVSSPTATLTDRQKAFIAVGD